MEIITGRNPIDYSRAPGEVSSKFFKCSFIPFIHHMYSNHVCQTVLIATLQMNLVDWFKVMVASRRGEELVDSLIEVHPPPRALKRALLVCLRCIDLDPLKRPKMGQVVHMLEAEDFPFRSVSSSSHFNSISIFFHV